MRAPHLSSPAAQHIKFEYGAHSPNPTDHKDADIRHSKTAYTNPKTTISKTTHTNYASAADTMVSLWTVPAVHS